MAPWTKKANASPPTSAQDGVGDCVGKRVWVPEVLNGYVLAKITDIAAGNKFSVELESDNNKSLHFPCDRVYPAERSLDRDVDDNCALMYLNDASLLHNVRIRYEKQKIYTYVANILIAVNPYMNVRDLYSIENLRRYIGRSLGQLPPHVFAIAERAYIELRRTNRSQSIIVSGESGAGKTESQKHVLRYLCEGHGHPAVTGSVEQRILETNPILESFGNAKTLRNNNSSRFGKFVEIHFDKKYAVSGGYVSHYLLEKSRVCRQQAGERNYHIFYQLCAGSPNELYSSLALLPPDKYEYLRHGCVQYFSANKDSERKIPKNRASTDHESQRALRDSIVDDVRDFPRLDAALEAIGLDAAARQHLYCVVAGVLALGNVEFDEDPADTKGGCCVATTDVSRSALSNASRLLGVDDTALSHGLTARIMTTTKWGVIGTVIRVPLKRSEAVHARDALAKAIYSRLFDYVVSRINQCIPLSESYGYVGVLDIAGFEYFTHNSFEQFCINYCNEKLQQFFNDRILKQEQELYAKEGLKIKHVDFVDNQDCIDLIEERSVGIFDLLDEENKLPRPSPQHFTTAVHEKHKTHFRLEVPRKSKLREHRDIREDEGFLIRHFAGAVCYNTGRFIDKNNDALHDSLEHLMLDSNSPLMRELFGRRNSAPENRKGKLNFVSVGSKFRRQLSELMGKLNETGTHFVRCVKPNLKMVPSEFEGGHILNQLQCSGMSDVLQLMQQGYPSRTHFTTLYDMYRSVMPPDLARLDPRLFCKCLFKALGLNDNDFAFGQTRVFFRAGKFAEFDKLLQGDPAHLRALINRVRVWLIRARWRKAQFGAWSVIKLKNKMIYRRSCLVKIQSAVRSYLAQAKHRHRYRTIARLRALLSEMTAMRGIVRKDANQAFHVEALQAAVDEAITRIRTESNISPAECEQLYSDLSTCLEHLMADARQQQARTKREETERQRLELVERQMHERKVHEEEQQVKERTLKKERLDLVALEQRRREAEKQFEKEMQVKTAEFSDDIEKQKEEESKWRQRMEQERTDHALALQLARESHGHVDELRLEGMPTPKAPLERAKNVQFDLTKWRYAELRDAINTSNDLALLQACRDEFNRRLRTYHVWRQRNKAAMTGQDDSIGQMGDSDARTPRSIQASACSALPRSSANQSGQDAAQRFFRVPFMPPRASSRGTIRRGYWYAHFDGQYIVRQMELHPDKLPVLLTAGHDDLDMCELSLEETGLSRRRGAEILPSQFEAEWQRNSVVLADYGERRVTK